MATTTKRGAKTTKSAATRTTTKSTTKKASASKRSVTTKKAPKKTSKVTEKAVSTRAEPTLKSNSVINKFKSLNNWNWILAMLHAAQGIVVIALSQDKLFPVTANYITTDPLASTSGSPVLASATRHLFDVNLAYIIAAFFFMSAIAHLVIATVYRKRYEANLQRGMNKARWVEYSLSASTMMLAISYLVGVTDFSTLLLIFGATAVMNLCGLIMEVHNQTTSKTNWLSYKIGTLAGLLPWVVVGKYLFDASYYGEGNIPTFVYWIYGSIFVFFMSFAVNMWLQYRGKGRWSDYLYGEKTYMVLSLVAKSVLAWQVFAGTLRP